MIVIIIITREEPVHRTPKGLLPTLKLALLGYPLSQCQIRPHSATDKQTNILIILI